jgi:hypothetical protein
MSCGVAIGNKAGHPRSTKRPRAWLSRAGVTFKRAWFSSFQHQIVGSVTSALFVVCSATWVVAQSVTQKRAGSNDESCRRFDGSRTAEIGVVNETVQAIDFWVVELFDTVGGTDTGTMSNTGVYGRHTGIVDGGSNIAPGHAASIDPCIVILEKEPIRGNVCKGSAKMKDGRFITLPKLTAPPGTYFRTCGWLLKSSMELSGESTTLVRSTSSLLPGR